MRDQSSRFSGNSRRATLAAALVVAGLGVGAAGCGDDEDSVNDAIDEAQEQVQSVQSQAETAINEAQEKAESVQTEAEEKANSVQEQFDDDGGSDSGSGDSGSDDSGSGSGGY